MSCHRIERVRSVTDQPVAVGIGVSTGDQAHAVAQFADGVIVGSASVRRMLSAPDSDAPSAAVGELTRELAANVNRHTEVSQ